MMVSRWLHHGRPPGMEKRNFPDSDESARRAIENLESEEEDISTETEGRQISNKTGKRSSAEKLASSRPEFGTSPGAHPVSGASGTSDELGSLDDVADDIEAADSDRQGSLKTSVLGQKPSK